MQPPGAALLFHRREARRAGDPCALAMVDHGRSAAGDREQVPKARHAASTTRRRNMVAAIRSVREWGAARQFWQIGRAHV